jgi:lactaldehyde dehydrogenase / glycolaldehyde dehydrogenase
MNGEGAAAQPALTQHDLLGGAWRRSTGDAIPVINPADERVLASVPSATGDEVHQALLAAKSAQRGWARTPTIVRGGCLRAMADVVSRHRDKLAELIVSEVGKPARQAAGELDFAVGFLSYNAEWDRRLEGETLPGDVPGEVIQLSHAPVGRGRRDLPVGTATSRSASRQC